MPFYFKSKPSEWYTVACIAGVLKKHMKGTKLWASAKNDKQGEGVFSPPPPPSHSTPPHLSLIFCSPQACSLVHLLAHSLVRSLHLETAAMQARNTVPVIFWLKTYCDYANSGHFRFLYPKQYHLKHFTPLLGTTGTTSLASLLKEVWNTYIYFFSLDNNNLVGFQENYLIICLMTGSQIHFSWGENEIFIIINLCDGYVTIITWKHFFSLKDLMAKVIKDTPEDPIAYLIKVLKRLYSEGGSKVG